MTPSPELVRLVQDGAAETDPVKKAAMYVEYQKAIIDQANLLILFQPIYQFAVRDTVKTFPLTAAGWEVELFQASPA
jgi:peptide/nickel transport system substrate-binding protein